MERFFVKKWILVYIGKFLLGNFKVLMEFFKININKNYLSMMLFGIRNILVSSVKEN